MRERGMWWDDLRAIIRRNQASNAFITYYRDPEINPDNIAIYDRLKVRRNPDALEKTGWDAEDHWRDSHICEAAFFNGEIPIQGSEGTYRGDKFVSKPYRGVLATLEIMLNEGCLRRTDELRELFARHGRRFPSTPT